MLWIIGAIIIGLIAGFLARAVVPGKDDMGLGGTLVLGLVGSLIGGFAYFAHDAVSTSFDVNIHWMIFALAGAVLIGVLTYYSVTRTAAIMSGAPMTAPFWPSPRLIASSTSRPAVTCPTTVYCPFRKSP